MFGKSLLKETLELMQKDNARLTQKIDLIQITVDEIAEERDELEDQKAKLQKEIRELKHQKKLEKDELTHTRKLEEQGIKATIKAAQEKRDLDLERKALELERAQQKAIAKVKDEYQDKTQQLLEKQLTEFRGMYDAILERLPNINAKITGTL